MAATTTTDLFIPHPNKFMGRDLDLPRRHTRAMAAKCSCSLLLALLSLLAVYSTGTLVVAGYSLVWTVKFCRIVENEIPVCGFSDHLFLDGTVVENLILAGASGVSSLKSSIVTSLHHTRLDGIVLDFGKRSGDLFELRRILSTVRSVSEALGEIRVEDDDSSIKLSVVFAMAFLEKLGKEYGRDQLHSLFNACQNVLRMVIVEDNCFRIESRRGDKVASSLADRAIFVVPPDKFVLSVFIGRLTPPGTSEAAELAGTVSKYLRSSSHSGIYIVELPVDASGLELYKRDRKLLDATAASTLPMTPIQAIPITTLDTSTPNIVTVPGTTPVTVTPNIPSTTPATFPSTTPVVYPPANPIPVPATAATPITIPGAGAVPVTNPVTTYPSPPVSTVPVTTPVTNPVAPPAMTNTPAIPGQSWCVARTGVTDGALQVAIDYACGIGGADCSQIQEGASCYIPNTFQNHASYAFNSYYQRNPAATSCDFGGTAVIVNSNPSIGSCVYPNTASVATPATVAAPATVALPSTTTTSSSPNPTTVAPLISSGSPPATVNPTTGAPLGFTTDSPQAMNTSTSISVALVPGCHAFILSCLVAAKFVQGR